MCGAETGSAEACREQYFGDVLAREYHSPAYGKAHLVTVDSFVLQHSEDHGPRSNALHLVRLGWLLYGGGDPDLRQKIKGPIPYIMEHFYRSFPDIRVPAGRRGDVTVLDLYRAKGPDEHDIAAYRWGKSVWEAYAAHHAWAESVLRDAGVSLATEGYKK